MSQKLSCFAIPSVFSFTSETCLTCCDRAECQGRSYAALLTLKDPRIAQSLIAEHKAHTAPQKPLYEHSAEIRRMVKKGQDVTFKVLAIRGENPFPEIGFISHRVAFHHLMLGGYTKPVLRQILQDELGWSKGAAATQVTMLWRVLQEIGVAEEVGVTLVPVKEIPCTGKPRYR